MSVSPRAPDAHEACQQQSKFLELVAQGTPLDEAALGADWTLNGVLQLVKDDPSFDRQLQAVQQTATCDPLRLMQQHARGHWRAAAWLLERTDPEHYGRRTPSSCGAQQFQNSLDAVLEAALAAAPQEHRRAVYQSVKSTAEKTFRTVFPNHDLAGPRAKDLPARPVPLIHQEEFHDLLESVSQWSSDQPVAPTTATASQLPGQTTVRPLPNPPGILSPKTQAATKFDLCVTAARPHRFTAQQDDATADPTPLTPPTRPAVDAARNASRHIRAPATGVPTNSVARNPLRD